VTSPTPAAAPGVRDARPEDFLAVATVLSDAFLFGDLAPWLVSQLDDRAEIYPGYFNMIAEHAFEHGQVQVTADRHGVALWYHHDGSAPPPIRDYKKRLAEITAPYTGRFVALDDAMRRRHPREPHHYLGHLAVHPDKQNLGYGSQLLRHHHAELDAAGISAHLEATGDRNRELYARNGYQDRQPYPIARNGPQLYPMWRPPTGP
jgi:ribosomal protein S18 acetylase RimI-like enzyme